MAQRMGRERGRRGLGNSVGEGPGGAGDEQHGCLEDSSPVAPGPVEEEGEVGGVDGVALSAPLRGAPLPWGEGGWLRRASRLMWPFLYWTKSSQARRRVPQWRS